MRATFKRTAMLSLLGAAIIFGSVQAYANRGGHGGFGGRGHGGPGAMLWRALRDVNLTDAQQAQVDRLLAAARARHATTRARMQDLASTLAGQVEDGRVNRVALQPKVDALRADSVANRPADRAALEQLHALLTPVQRAQLVDAVKARIAKRQARHQGQGGKQIGQRWMGKLGAQLQLTDQQKQQIAQALRAKFAGQQRGDTFRKTMQARMTRLLDAFKSDRFVMNDVAPAADARKAAGKMATRFEDGLSTVLPYLTPVQRANLAKIIRARAAHQHGQTAG